MVTGILLGTIMYACVYRREWLLAFRTANKNREKAASCYYIGREDQSVNENVMISRIDQQIKVNKLMIDYLTEKKQTLTKQKRLYQYMRNYLEIISHKGGVQIHKGYPHRRYAREAGFHIPSEALF